jgi:teichuronic acid biosynthesis glycosyltransferase TuaC
MSSRRQLKILAVTNMYPTERSPDSGTFIAAQVEGLQRIGVNVEVFRVDRERRGRSAYTGLSGKLRRAALEGTFDLMHVMYGGVMAERATRSMVLPIVVSFCGSDLQGAPREPLLARLSAWYGVWASRRAAQRADAITVKSRGLREALPAGLDRKLENVIPDGIDLELFRPLERQQCRQALGWERDRCHFLFHRSSNPGKRVELARGAVALAARRGLRVELHELAGVERTQVPLWMGASDALLFTSVLEGSPNIVKEALACDVPVLSVDVGDVRERLSGIEGCAIVPDDVHAIADAIEQVCRRGARINGRSTIESLSTENVARQLLNVYATALKHRTSGESASWLSDDDDVVGLRP